MEYMDDFLIYSTEVRDKLVGTPVVIDTMSGIWLCGTICWRLHLMKARAISEMTKKQKKKPFLKYGDLPIISGNLRYSALVLQLHRSNP